MSRNNRIYRITRKNRVTFGVAETYYSDDEEKIKAKGNFIDGEFDSIKELKNHFKNIVKDIDICIERDVILDEEQSLYENLIKAGLEDVKNENFAPKPWSNDDTKNKDIDEGVGQKIDYDHTFDLMYVSLTDHKVVETEEVCSNVIVDYDDAWDPVGVEILNASKTLGAIDLMIHKCLDVIKEGHYPELDIVFAQQIVQEIKEIRKNRKVNSGNDEGLDKVA